MLEVSSLLADMHLGKQSYFFLFGFLNEKEELGFF